MARLSLHTLAEIPSAAQFGDNDALIETGGGPTLSYKQLEGAVNGVAERLRAAGFQPGSVITITLTNTIAFVAAFLGTTHARCVAAPLNSKYSVEEFKFYLEDAESALVLVPTEGNAHAEEAAATLKIPVATVTHDGKGGVTLTPKTFAEKWSAATAVPKTPAEPDDVAMFLHTSGTTSRPKGVPLTHKNMVTTIANIVEHYKLTPQDRTYLVMPLFHVHGLMAALLSTLASGGAVGMPKTGAFSAQSFWPGLMETKATWYTAVPTIHQILLMRADKEYPKDTPPKLRFIRSCSASLAPAVLEQLEKVFGAPVLEAYAMTEASHQMTSNPLPENGPHKPGSVGKGTNVKVAIFDDNNNILPVGQVGEVCIQGENVTKGYKNNPEANKAGFAGGWFHTGDQGFIDEDGYVTLTGRIKELINRGGEKISPLEVDAALLGHPAVGEAVAFAAPDPLYGECVAAAVVLKASGKGTTAEDIQEFLKTHLAPFKVPKRLFICDDFPRTATGKIQRRHVATFFLEKKDG
eukprot:comp23093_c0_seq2/m.37093 comp23093_c0_seq2/g.37093  ORF comp23093_c0_seq2/g.37093 comp23093_c0_seq2/m.37093 type:complete len:522 (-) comp23093_c0_seq2:350-1915(-)